MQSPVMTFFSRAGNMNLFAIDPFGDEHLIEECEDFGLFGFWNASINTTLGISEIANILFELRIIRNHYIGRMIYLKKVSDA